MIQDIILSIFLGVGLSAAVGFRIFLPLLALSVANHFNVIPLGETFEWVGTIPAMVALGLASLLEIGAYYIPWVDNLLDTAAVPLATLAGTGVMAASVVDLSPMLTWGLAIIAGGGTAGVIKSASAGTRLVSTASTAGVGNPAVSTIETGTSIVLIFLAIVIPVLAIIAVIGIFYLMYKIFRKLAKRKNNNTKEVAVSEKKLENI